MNIQNFNYAQKYAIAFLNLFIDSIMPTHVSDIEKAAEYFKANYHYLVLLEIPLVSEEVRRKAFDNIFKNYHLPATFDHLIEVVLKRHQLILMPDILEQVVREYYIRKKTIIFTVESTYCLDSKEIDQIKTFLVRTIPHKNIIINQKINNALIAGLRIYSDTLLWEYSIEKQLRAIEKTLIG